MNPEGNDGYQDAILVFLSWWNYCNSGNLLWKSRERATGCFFGYFPLDYGRNLVHYIL